MASATTARPRRLLTRTQRTRLFRGTLYLLLVLLTVVLGLAVDWAAVQRAFFNPDVALETMPLMITRAARNTVIYTVGSFVIGLFLGLLLALMKLSPVAPYRWIATAYIEFFRGLPAILTIFLVGFSLPIAFDGVRVPFGTPGSGTLALGLVAAAYMAETIRAGIQAVPRGQVEAARSLGMSQGRAMASIVLPQAFRIIVPPLTNEVVLLIKDTSLFFVIGFQIQQKDIFTFSRDIATNNFNATPLIVGGFVYLAITLPLTRLVAALERRQSRAR
ncbi:MAG: amino acid ABC transporter permease [Actinomycetes bacterium]